MKGLNQIYRRQEGSILMVVLGLILIASWLIITILNVASNSRKISTEQASMEQAMFVAEGGLERGARFMEANLATMVSSATGATNGSGSLGGGTFVYNIFRTNSSTYCIVSTGTVNGVTRVVSLMDVYQPSYAEFALWSATNGAIYFVNGETFTGHVHADDKLYFDASGTGPIFHDIVTSDSGTYSVKNGTIADIEFDKGYTLNSFQGTMADVDFNSAASTSLKNSANSVGLLLDGTTTLTFNGATISITNTRKSWVNHTYTPSAEGLIYVRNAVSGASDVSGTIYLNGGSVKGRLTVASEADMTIAGNITYKTDPTTTPSSTDALGLISMGDIWVGTSAPNNLKIQAAIMATGVNGGDNGSFGVVNYNTGSSRGVLTVYGGIVQETRGAVGTGSGSTGFTKNYSYDSRFISTPPPYYPIIASKVSFNQWQEGK